jgi:transmembrane sensor
MTAPEKLRSDDELDAQAAAWLCERDDGFAPGRARAFAAWRDRDARHAAAIERVEATLALLAEMPAVREPLMARCGPPRGEPGRERSRRVLPFPRLAWVGGMAAAVLIGLAAWWALPDLTAGAEQYAAAAAAQRRVALRDGSTVDLNAGTRVAVEFSRTERRVQFEDGEAYFDIAPDPTRPFVVHAGDLRIRAVGTAFNVRIQSDGIDVVVTEGKVEVGPRAAAGAAGDAAPQVSAGERLRVPREPVQKPVKVEKIAPVEVRQLLAWQEPMMTFNDVPLRAILERLNHRNVTQVLLDDPTLGERRIGGAIALDQVDAFVRLLEQDGDLVAERRGENEIILRRTR